MSEKNKKQAKQKNEEQEAQASLYDLTAESDDTTEMEEVSSSFEKFPIFGVNDFTVGKPIVGIYLGNETRGKDDDGVDRQIHVLKNPKTDEKFGLWERTGTASAFKKISPNTLVKVIYEGQLEKHPNDPKKSPPHMFKVLASKDRPQTTA